MRLQPIFAHPYANILAFPPAKIYEFALFPPTFELSRLKQFLRPIHKFVSIFQGHLELRSIRGRKEGRNRGRTNVDARREGGADIQYQIIIAVTTA